MFMPPMSSVTYLGSIDLVIRNSLANFDCSSQSAAAFPVLFQWASQLVSPPKSLCKRSQVQVRCDDLSQATAIINCKVFLTTPYDGNAKDI